MTATPEEIAAALVDTIADIVSDAQYVGGGPEPYTKRIVGAIAAGRERQAAEIARLRSIIGDTVWCDACGSLVPLDDPTCDCMDEDQQSLRVYDRETTEAARAKVVECGELRAEIARLRAGGCARDQGLTQYCAEAVGLAAEIERLRAATQWRPIAEAPKDGTPVLVYVPESRSKTLGTVQVGKCRPGSGGDGIWVIGGLFAWDVGTITHFAPLPPPPPADTMET